MQAKTSGTIMAPFIGAMVVAVLSGYALLSPLVAQPIYNNMLFYPNYPARYEEARYQLKALQGIAKEDVYIPLPDNSKIHAWFFRYPGSRQVLLVSHGNASNMTYRMFLAEDFLKLGCSVLLYDYEGYGLSGGAPSVANISRDGVAAFDYLHTKLGYANKDIILYGESLGCSVSGEIAKYRPCGGIILQSGFSALKAIAAERFSIFYAYPDALFPKPALDNITIFRGEHAPLLVLHGQHDDVVPFGHGRHVFEAASEPKSFVALPHSGHYVVQEDHDLYIEHIRNFLVSLKDEVGSAPAPLPSTLPSSGPR